MTNRRLFSLLIAIALLLIPVSTLAQTGFTVGLDSSVTCDWATLTATVDGGTEPYILSWDFGDGETRVDVVADIADFPFSVNHEYLLAGDYPLELAAMDDTGLTASVTETIAVGPSVTLMSDPFPPLLVLENDKAAVDFTAEVRGDQGPYTFVWDLNGDGIPEADEVSDKASYTYIEAGKYQASVQVIDGCGLVGEDSLPVIVIDPDEEACHPMAQRIADGINTLFPDQAGDLYTCEDIFAMFRGGLTGSQLGFGRMWHAYKLAQTIQDLTWEEIRDWHLDGNGWGGLVQLNRFADLLEQHGVRELVELVASGEASINEVRHSVRSVMRYEADFEDALMRLGDGMSPGGLGQFYRTAQDLQLSPDELDTYLVSGTSLQELKHAARIADRSGSDWAQIAEAHSAGHSWGAIGQAQRMAEDGDWMSVLDSGVRETREQTREADRSDREQERIDQTAEQLATRHNVSAQQVLDLYYGDCALDWGCVRKTLRNQPQSDTVSDQEQKKAARLANQYGVSESEVWSLYDGSCGSSWSCVRAELRADYSGRGGGPKPKD